MAVTAAATVMCWYVLVAIIIAAVRRFLATRVSRIIDAARHHPGRPDRHHGAAALAAAPAVQA
jgi:hypothetical protein